ncbi:MAG: nucleotidyltransferase [Chlamydiae bacterium]|nr:nucleotidyltransferase [Chlamydiota bacterium]MBI3266766.1 nucleotidyltransferase [Chlamydiota bacterium]
MHEEKDFKELLTLFNKHKVKYTVVGAFAVAFHAIPRYTKDLDVFVEPNTHNAERILHALKDFGFESIKLTIKDFEKPGKTVQLGYEPVRIDLITSIDGCTFEEVWKNRQKGKYGGEIVFFIGLEELIKNKHASNRPQDRIDLEKIKKINQKKSLRKR